MEKRINILRPFYFLCKKRILFTKSDTGAAPGIFGVSENFIKDRENAV